jgi:N-carbamoylputrescine amidase
MRIAFVEWPDALSTTGARWDELKDSVEAVRADLLITNELPFGPWLADSAVFSKDEANLSLRAHEKGGEGLIDLALPAVISSRPVWNGKRLANEAFVLENEPSVRCTENSIFRTSRDGLKANGTPAMAQALA